jgi:hypothetical protein
MRARLDVVDGRIREAFDAHDGQNDDGRGLIRVGAAEAHDAPVVRKLYDVAHQPLSLDGRPGSLNPIR